LSGAVTLSLEGTPRESAVGELKALPGVKDLLVLSDEGSVLRVRLFGKHGRKHAEALSAAVAGKAASRSWKLRELRNEEGRLDEVFRSITLPDSEPATEAKKKR
jgi:ABC-2 type transport system ATP-binding protein